MTNDFYRFSNKIMLIFLCAWGSYTLNGQSVNSKSAKKGKALFDLHCMSCHGITSGNFGPKLGGVLATRPLDELYQFVKKPAQFIQNGDYRTKVLLDKYKSEMPAFGHLKDSEIKSIFDYIQRETLIQNEAPLSVNALIPKKTDKRYAPAIKPSKLYIELADFATFPKQPNTPNDKGIATLRTLPNRANEYFVSDQMGVIYRIKDKKVEQYFDIRPFKKDFIFTPGIGTGLGSFDFHPDFAKNGLFYTTHAEKYLEKPAINDKAWADSIGVGLQWVITEWQVEDVNAFPFKGKNREVLRFNTPTTAHGGQDLSFVPNVQKGDKDYGLLYLGIGDGGSNNIKLPELCHSPKSLLGTIIRIDPLSKNGVFDSYGIPPDNPFANQTEKGIQKEIYAFGFRNPHRFAWFEGKMLAADIGEANVEELNLVQNGGDYGWSHQEGLYGISSKIDKTVVFDISDAEKAKYIPPIAQYDHNDGNAISGGFVYKGALKALENKYIFGDIVTGRLLFMDTENLETGKDLFDINIIENGKETAIRAIIKQKRTQLRIGYDQFSGDLFIMTKPDNTIRKVVKAYFK
jgi:glucose/arabinose dehydrogenase/mono/diheme cytochrome c family protein